MLNAPWWDPVLHPILSNQLWLPSISDSKEVNLKYISSVFDNSWCNVKCHTSKNCQKPPVQLCPATEPTIVEIPGIMKPHNKDKPPKVQKIGPCKAQRYPLICSSNQRYLLNQGFSAARKVYNQCVEYAQNQWEQYQEAMASDIEPKPEKPKIDGVVLKHLFIPKKFTGRDKWMGKVNRDVLRNIIKDFFTARKAAFTNLRNGNIDHFEMGFKSRKDTSQSIEIDTRDKSIDVLDDKKSFTLYRKWLGNVPFRTHTVLPDINYGCRIQKCRGVFYLCVPLALKPEQHTDSPKHSIIALDPGVRTFLTGYDYITKRVIEFGKDDFNRLARLGKHLSKMQSEVTKSPKKVRYKLKKKMARLRARIQNLVKDTHCKIVHWLTYTYSSILLPKFEVSKMVKKRDKVYRVLGTEQTKNLLHWSHYKFQQRLLNKTRERNWCKVHIVGEEYTTKCCTNCGNLKPMKAERIYNCHKCGSVIGRDANAARNILMKNVSWAFEQKMVLKPLPNSNEKRQTVETEVEAKKCRSDESLNERVGFSEETEPIERKNDWT